MTYLTQPTSILSPQHTASMSTATSMTVTIPMATPLRVQLSQQANLIGKFSTDHNRWVFPRSLHDDQKTLLDEIEAAIILWRNTPDWLTDSEAWRVSNMLLRTKTTDFFAKVFEYTYIADKMDSIYEAAKAEITDEFPELSEEEVHVEAVFACKNNSWFSKQDDLFQERWRAMAERLRTK